MGQTKIHPDQMYLEGLAANDSAIIQSIYKKYVPKVVMFIMNNSGDQEHARAVVQEIMILLFDHAKAGTLQLTCPFDAYFFLLCKRKWLNKFKKTGSRGVTITEDIISINESALELIGQTEDFNVRQQLYDKMCNKLGKKYPDLFEQYLHGAMTVAERDNFTKRLAEDRDLTLEFETFKEMEWQLKNKLEYDAERQIFKENLAKISEAHFDNKPKVVGLKPWYLAVALSVAILVGLFFFNYNQNPVFGDYNNPEHASFSETANASEALKKAEMAYNKKRYNDAIPFFETVLQNKKTPEIQFFYGVSLLEESHYLKAEAIFKKLKAGDSLYKEKATWYLALCKLKQKDYAGCKQILQTMSKDYERYALVKELLDRLK